jgi:hypothetical protein
MKNICPSTNNLTFAANRSTMPRISVDITPETEKYLIGQKLSKGSSISFEANLLIEQTIKERNRKKKPNGAETNKGNNPE